MIPIIPSIRKETAVALLINVIFALLAFGARGQDSTPSPTPTTTPTPSAAVQQMRENIVLTPTLLAPADSSVKAELEVQTEHGQTHASLKLEPENLTPATYTVAVTLKSDGSTVTLGTFDVAPAGTTDDSSDLNEDENENDDQDSLEIEFGADGIPFPTGFDARDIATISILDASSAAVFTGDFTDLATVLRGRFHANTELTGAPTGTTMPAARGRANIVVQVKRGVARGLMVLNGRGLTPDTDYVLSFNGVDAATVHSTKNGGLRFKSSPSGHSRHGNATLDSASLFGVKSIHIHDISGQDVLAADL
ncbi:MAG: hypothetical protein M3O82_06135 [Verrucomicrobiota bacterium]|nr:hypothetical protein [Verrucomicrobiota bacterium]